MIQALQKDDALLEDIRSVPSTIDAFQLWWLGQSGFLLHWNGHLLLLDPFLSDSLTKKYAGTDKPHVPMSELVISPGRLKGIRWVTSSHCHTDHLDRETLAPLADANPGLTLILPEANEDFARQRLAGVKMSYLGVNEAAPVAAGPFSLTGIAAAHNAIDRDPAGRCLYLGFIVRFGPFCLYHSGDTLWHEGLVSGLLPAQPDLALVPINGNLPERRVAGNLNGTEAASLAKAVGARLAVPHHFHQFEFNTAEPDEFVSVCERLNQPCRVLRGGERLEMHTRP